MVELRTTDDTTAKTRITHKVLPRRVRSWPHNNNGAPGGLARAATAIRSPGGRFVGGKATPAQKELLQHQRDADREIMMALKDLPAILDKPVAEMTEAEVFTSNFRKSLSFAHEVLSRPVDWSDEKLLDRKERIALATQTAAVRIKVAELKPPSDEGVVERLMQRVAALRRGERLMSPTVIESVTDDA